MDKSFSILDLLMIFLRKKKRILAHFLIISIVSVIVSLVIPKNYKATTLFLPPQEDSPGISGLSLGNMLNIGRSSAFSPQQIETLLDSRKVLEATVEKFDLIDLYKTRALPNKTEKAVKMLRENIKVTSATEEGLTQTAIIHYSLSVVDKDRRRAADMANFIIDELGRVMNELSRGQYSYSEKFMRTRLDSVVEQKFALQARLATFQKANKIYSPKLDPQVLASVSNYAELKQQKMLSEIQKNLLLEDREGQSREVRAAEARIRQLDKKMKEIEEGRDPSVLPGLNYSVDVAYEYLNMVQEAEVLTRLEIMLRQQYEEARIRSARSAPTVRVVDRAKPPEWKNSPKKAFIVLGMVGVYMTILLISILVSHGLARAPEETRAKLRQFREAMRFRAG